MLRVIQKGKHRKRCRAVQQVVWGHWNTPWYLDEHRWLDINAGKKGNTTHWLVFKCNDVDHLCEAQLFIKVDDILALAEKELKKGE